MDKRIGLYNEDGSVAQWPEVDVQGSGYSRPATTHNLDTRHFVVLPAGFDNAALLDELRAGLAPVEPPAVTRRKKDEGNGEPSRI